MHLVTNNTAVRRIFFSTLAGTSIYLKIDAKLGIFYYYYYLHTIYDSIHKISAYVVPTYHVLYY